MTPAQGLQRLVERALAFAHAAVDEPTPYRVLEARRHADAVVPQLDRLKQPTFTLTEASGIVLMVAQLRAVLDVLDHLLHPVQRASLPS